MKFQILKFYRQNLLIICTFPVNLFMNNKLTAVLIIIMSSIISHKNSAQSTLNVFQGSKDLKPPVAEIKSYQRILHGDTVTDNYYWMIDYFKKGPDSTKVVDYLKAENVYLDTMMSGTKNFEEKLFTEMKSRIKEKDESVPVFKNGFFYYSRTEEGKQYFKYCRKKGTLDAKEEVLFDADEMAKGHPYYSAVGFNISEDNKLMAFGVDTVSRRQYTIYIKNLETSEIYKDAMTPASGSSVWANDNKNTFLYKE